MLAQSISVGPGHQITTLGSPAKKISLNVVNTSQGVNTQAARGVSWYDYDSDGFLDLFLAGGRNSDRLFHNNKDGTFTDVTNQVGLADSKNTSVGIFADFDNDGCPDLFLAKGKYSNREDLDKLYSGSCATTFTFIDVSQKLNIRLGHSQGAAWADYDNDGYLDLYVAKTDQIRSEKDFDRIPNVLYHNNHDGTFTSVTDALGIDGVNHCPVVKYGVGNTRILSSEALPAWKPSFQPIWFDYNNDGLPDLFVTNDGGVSQLYQNKGGGKFFNTTSQAGLCVLGSGMGVDAGDYDNDGFMDLYVTNVGYNYLWHNNGDGTFVDEALPANVADYNQVGWGVNFIDLDNDGYLDLYVVNGSILEGSIDRSVNDKRKKITSNRDHIFINTHRHTFEDVFENAISHNEHAKLSISSADYNNDGLVDFFLTEERGLMTGVNPRNYLYENRTNNNNWITIHLIGTVSNRDAIGAKIILTTNTIPNQTREVRAGGSFLSQNSLWQNFGIESNLEISKLEINWPSGKKQLLVNVKPNQILTITEPK